MINKIILFFFLLGCFITSPAQEWKQSTETDGIKVFNSTAPTTSKIKPIKIECTFNASAAQLVAVLLDIKNYNDWVYHNKSATIVKQVSPQELYYYAEINVPWPAQNRDFVAHITVNQNAETKIITVDAPTVPNFMPEKANLARIHESKGKWILTPAGPNQVKVVYFLQIDPGGNSPAWIINLFASDGPLQTFKKLKLQLQKPEYKNVSLPFIHN